MINTYLKIIQKIQLRPYDWLDEGIQPPNKVVIESSITVLNKLDLKNIYPTSIKPSVEEGLLMSFQNKSEILHFELYNDGQLGYIIEDAKNKKILDNKDVGSLEDIVNKLVNFFQI